MLGVTWRQLRRRRWRASALAGGILVAAVAFALLTASVTTTRVNASAAVASELRGAYDILVRPAAAAAGAGNVVPANYFSDIYGGISQAQYRQISGLPGVAVAAPIETVGYVLINVRVPVDVTRLLARSGGAQVLALSSRYQADQDMSSYPEQRSNYVYVTTGPVRAVPAAVPGTPAGQVETLRGGKRAVICPAAAGVWRTDPFGPPPALPGVCASRPQLRGGDGQQKNLPPVAGYVTWTLPLLVAAIDPAAEDRLAGLSGAVTAGRYLTAQDGPAAVPAATRTAGGAGAAGATGSGPERKPAMVTIPVLASASLGTDLTDQVTIERLPASASALVQRGLSARQLTAALSRLTGPTAGQVTLTAGQAYAEFLRQHPLTGAATAAGSGTARGRVAGAGGVMVGAYWTTGPVSYADGGGGALTARPVANPASVWTSAAGDGFVAAPVTSADVGFRKLTEHLANGIGSGSQPVVSLALVGQLDPGQLAWYGATPPLEIASGSGTAGSGLTGAGAGSGKLALPPTGDIAGLNGGGPVLLTTLAAARALQDPASYSGLPGSAAAAPISAIRIRVSGLTGSLSQRLAQLTRVASEIRKRTGLVTDITAGSSLVTTTVDVPAGRYGRPAMTMSQPGFRDGVAATLTSAIDRESAVLLLLILIVTGFFLANSTFASVRGRRADIGVLRAMGWRRGGIFRMILGEVMALGLVAGLAGAAIGAAAIALLGLTLPWYRVLLVPPVAVALAAVASAIPAWRAGRGDPMDAMTPRVPIPRRARPVRTVRGLALANVRRAPGRSVVTAAALTVGVAALIILLSVQLGFSGDAGASALGGIVTSRVAWTETLSAVLAIGLGAASVADITYLNMRERGTELATLTATGWRPDHLARLLRAEALAVGFAGVAAGLLVGLAVAALVVGDPLAVAGAAVAAAAGAVAVVVAATEAMLALERRNQVVDELAGED